MHQRRDRQDHQVLDAQARQAEPGLLRQTGAGMAEALASVHRCIGQRMVADTEIQGAVLESRAAAVGAGVVAAIAREQHAHMHLVAAPLEPVEEAAEAIPDARSRVIVPVAFTLQDPVAIGLGQLGPRHVGWDAAPMGEGDQVLLDLRIAIGLDRLDGAIEQRLARIGHHQIPVDADHATEAAAGLAGADRRVEREQAGDRLAVVDVAVGAVEVARKLPGRAGIALGIQGVDPRPATAVLEGGF